MDGRDLVRCLAVEGLGERSGSTVVADSLNKNNLFPPQTTELCRTFDPEGTFNKYSSMNTYRCYTASLEQGGTYDAERHYNGDFCDRKFITDLKGQVLASAIYSNGNSGNGNSGKGNGNGNSNGNGNGNGNGNPPSDKKPSKFHQIHLDYFWSPSGSWMLEHWGVKFFDTTLVEFLTRGVLFDLYEEERKVVEKARYDKWVRDNEGKKVSERSERSLLKTRIRARATTKLTLFHSLNSFRTFFASLGAERFVRRRGLDPQTNISHPVADPPTPQE